MAYTWQAMLPVLYTDCLREQCDCSFAQQLRPSCLSEGAIRTRDCKIVTVGLILQALPGSYRAASWPEDRLGGLNAGEKGQQLGSASGEQLLTWRKRLPQIIAAFERNLQELLSSVVLLLVEKVLLSFVT